MAGKILFVGESWHVHTMESKGFDVFTYDYYEEAVGYIQEALCANGWEFEHIPSHLVEQRFPRSAEALSQYAAVFFSDVGANTLNLPMNVFMRQQPTLNKLDLVREYVENGGAFCMIGGYLSFQGIQGRAAYKRTPIEEILPVTLLEGDDRVEKSGGICVEAVDPSHAALTGIPAQWPQILGYNRLNSKEGAQVPVKVGNDPLLVLGSYGKGRTCAFATDCAPHWAPVPFCTWEGYKVLWGNIMRCLAD
ncbi:MAG TPA: cytoplasmic protein [Candidatus Pullichristensenella stercorigallinarum]|uniref:Cytoplasmic protein n=1 Tax=Candidatus Pullichristensenella stercorigallinarum TaxID=2840909 RepID=A0A9D1CXK5_9FIRM|nr:cytoplasmic protein [Candidatus Pullichristensenella stercorigallinarum]